ncbi:MAG: glycoside hydrolase family 127 protein [Bacteroidales bacterium]
MNAKREFILFLCLSLLIAGCGETPRQKISAETTPGEFSIRMGMARERLAADRYIPVYTPEFILADVNINPDNPRRFDNYSGDISGRYVEVMSRYLKEGDPGKLGELVKDILKFQHRDGRFGDTTLVFAEKHIDKNHMPLLWGNGRLLVGLLEYYNQTLNKDVLAAATRLGDFFLSSYREVTPVVAKRLEGLGADGIICFTQYVEPLVMLSQITGETKYAEVASIVYPTLPARGILHSHGYLTTLRGVLKLYEYDGNRLHFNYVLQAYRDLVNSDDYTLYGAVMEYFGGKGDRDEGCSTADFIRLSLHLYKLTQETEYLDRAEFAIYNALYFNQFFTGDFGHHVINQVESAPTIHHMAWWCCTMAGLRAMQVIQNEYFAESNNGSARLNLYLETDYTDENISLSVRKGGLDGEFHIYNVKLLRTEGMEEPLLLRKPPWSDEVEIYLNDRKIEAGIQNGYYSIEQKLNAGDLLQVRMTYQSKIITRDKRSVLTSDITGPVTGTLSYGPYILAIDNNLDYTFLSEPNNNTVYINTVRNVAGTGTANLIPEDSFSGDAYLTARYIHGGFPSYYDALFRPVSEMTFQKHPYMMITMQFIPE